MICVLLEICVHTKKEDQTESPDDQEKQHSTHQDDWQRHISTLILANKTTVNYIIIK